MRACTEHPILEHQRVRAFAEALTSPATDDGRAALGRLMFASHASYSACGLGSPGTDGLVAQVQRHAERSHPALWGAKITGGGSGGELADQHRAATGVGGQVFSGSSPGAARAGTIQLRRAAPSG